jgi:hypothetical protein
MRIQTVERRLVCFTLLIVLISSYALPSVISSASVLDGVCLGSLNDARALSVQSAKIAAIRVDVKFDTSFQDTYSSASKYRLKIVGILDYQTMNYQKNFTLDEWAAVVDKAAKTYTLIGTWEIWNEPTLTKYELGYMDGTPQHYVDMLRSAYMILKAANPEYQVLGLGGAQLGIAKDLTFAKSVFSLEGGAYMDAISVHAYPYKLNLGRSWENYKQIWVDELSQYRQLGKSIWVTETGLQSNQKNETSQVNYLRDSYAFFKEAGVVAYFWYQLVDYRASDGTVLMWGLLRMDRTAKPSYEALKSLP